MTDFFAPRFDEASKMGARMIKVIQESQRAGKATGKK